MEEQPKGTMQMIDALPARLAFWAGVVVTAGTIFAIEFIILIVMMLKGFDMPVFGGSDDTSAKSNSNTNAAAAVTDTAAAAGTIPSGTITDDSLRNVRGEGELTIVEYSDIDCPFCLRFHSTLQQVMTDYDGKVRWSYKHLPLTSLHPNAMQKALASECAADQGKFWDYLDGLFANASTSTDEITSVADEVGLDRATFDDCLSNTDTNDRVTADSTEAQKFGGRGTPYSLVIDKDGKIVDVIEGALPYDSVTAILDEHL